MSTFRVTVERLTVHPHPNADRLELAQVGLYRAVVEKGITLLCPRWRRDVLTVGVVRNQHRPRLTDHSDPSRFVL